MVRPEAVDVGRGNGFDDESATRSERHRVTSLKLLASLRPAAALLVFGFHLHVMGLFDDGTTGTVLDWLFSRCAGGFSCFFLLSGLVLTWSIRPTDTTVRFWRRRIARIYPNHLATWLLVLAMLMVSG